MITSKKSLFIGTFTALLTLAVVNLPFTALADSAAADFSSTVNPNGNWSYGWIYNPTDTLHLDTTNSQAYGATGLGAWLGNETDALPYLIKNQTGSPITINNTTYQPGQLAEQPGQSNEEAVVRWTAPASGSFSVNATFTGLSSLGASVDVFVYVNGTAVLSTIINGGINNPTAYSGVQNISAGGTVDFVVANGGNGPAEDNVGLAATVVAVPEPGALGLVAMGVVGLLSLRFMKGK